MGRHKQMKGAFVEVAKKEHTVAQLSSSGTIFLDWNIMKFNIRKRRSRQQRI